MSVPFHPPAAGGKTAWGVGELVSTTLQDVEELERRRKGAAEFNSREQTRLHGLKALDAQGEDILERRRRRKEEWENGLVNKGSANENKGQQLEILRKLEENKAQRKAERKEMNKGDRMLKKMQAKHRRQEKAKEQRNKKESSSSSSGSSSGGSSSNSSSEQKAKKPKIAEAPRAPVRMVAAAPPPAKPVELTPEQKAAAMDAKRKGEEQKAKEREVKAKAKQMLAEANEEAKKKAAVDEAKRQADIKKKASDAIAKNNAEAQAKKDAEQARKQAEEDKKSTPEAIARRKAAEEAAQKAKAPKLDVFAIKKANTLAGGHFKGQHVTALIDITIKGTMVVRKGTGGIVEGPADTDPVNRVAVKFVPRADGGTGRLNCVPREIRKG